LLVAVKNYACQLQQESIMSNPNRSEKNKTKGLSPLTLFGSLFASAFGVQTNKNRERDFKQGKFHHFIIGGIIFAVLFVLAVAGIVKLVLSNAGL
jgi:hypothetical protein